MEEVLWWFILSSVLCDIDYLDEIWISPGGLIMNFDVTWKVV